jgi:hypothetical protein
MSHETTASTASSIQQSVSRITYSDLCESIQTVLQTGQLGTPVNVRLHWEFTESASNLMNMLMAAVAIADESLQLKTPTWRVRRHSSDRSLNVLGSDQRGRTLMISLVAEALPQTALTIFGNHGIVRLDDGWVDPVSIPESFDDCAWLTDLQVAMSE